ncbi:hypothetical protein [Burkholderia pseudomultivorans]|uniref:Uncharacterized protein n=1 Tax=Burkholderia pseudomultivorans TaxID=1207504 RepID=A0A132EI73_9BURK|nr:hypothetical protein [Burkholderia pseudomultivorans]KWF30257.1 hypothetical protein WT56_14335 [Burkholderia pseudomultivorans]MDR8732163.1 hypothetical protein [Burkholderia pseudomultivorans]MDR8732968.1 hypothetical protein [Burkholderia pseudomultivorans]MDR8739834.1 hypothetical protein [Burkholderia pseudomultivorans]MDR8756084.1 hypothetical protein [Burkholderia pseudomultivorans]
MRIFLVALLLYSAQAAAQAVFQNPAVFVILSEQTLANAASVQQALTTLNRADNTACMPMMMVGDPQVIYMVPEAGHAPSWQSPVYGRGAPFDAQNGPAPTGKTIGAMQHAEDMQTQPWADSGAITQRIAGESSVSASSTVSDWQRAGLNAIETARADEVTVNGKTYRAYQHDINRSAQPVVEPQVYTQRVIFCR